MWTGYAFRQWLLHTSITSIAVVWNYKITKKSNITRVCIIGFMWWPYCTLPMVFQSKDITAAACAAFINRAGRICFFLLQLYFFVRLFVEIVYLFVFSLHLLICKAGDFGLFDLSSIISLKFFLRLFINFSFFLLNLILFIKKGQKSF